jgi:hypothetical protein
MVLPFDRLVRFDLDLENMSAHRRGSEFSLKFDTIVLAQVPRKPVRSPLNRCGQSLTAEGVNLLLLRLPVGSNSRYLTPVAFGKLRMMSS